MNALTKGFVAAHKGWDTLLTYAVTGSIILQESWPSANDYIPARWRHIVLGVITAVVVANKIHKAVPKDPPA